MIYMENVRLWMPRESINAILTALKTSLCVGCPAGEGVGDPPAAPPPFTVFARPIVNDPPISAALEYADLELGVNNLAGIELNDETPPDYCDGSLEGPALGGDGEWRIIMDQRIWTYATGAAQSVYGIALTFHDGSTDKLLGYGRLSAGPATFGEVGDVLKLSAELIPCMCLPPAIAEVPE